MIVPILVRRHNLLKGIRVMNYRGFIFHNLANVQPLDHVLLIDEFRHQLLNVVADLLHELVHLQLHALATNTFL